MLVQFVFHGALKPALFEETPHIQEVATACAIGANVEVFL
jgi:hypothetical protein